MEAVVVEAPSACETAASSSLRHEDSPLWQACAPTPIPADRVRRTLSEPPASRCQVANAASRQAAARREATRRRAADADLLRNHLDCAKQMVEERPPAGSGPSRFELLRARLAAKRDGGGGGT